MSAQTRIFVGDLVRALLRVGSSERNNWTAIAGLLGLGWSEGGDTDAKKILASPLNAQPPDLEQGKKSDASRTEATDKQVGELIEFDMQRSTAAAQPIVLDNGTPSPSSSALPYQLSPLFDPLWERGILLEAAGMPCAEGDLAVLEAVKLFATGEPLQKLPAERIQSVSKGCQVLIDAGLGMQPFVRDVRQILSSIRKAVGAERTHVLRFVDCPTTGVMSENYHDVLYAPPDNGAMVLAVSDLCNGGPRSAIREAAPEDWLTFAKCVRDAGSSLVVLNPYSPDRWPARVTDQVAVLHWDASTQAASVRHKRRRIRR